MKFYIGSGLKNGDRVDDVSKKLEANGWRCTYCWTANVQGDEAAEDLITYAMAEQKGILDADVVVILLPAGRGAHIELGMALALHKKIYLCSASQESFSLENTVDFYELPSVRKLVGPVDDLIEQIIQGEGVC